MQTLRKHGMKGSDFRLREELADQMKALKGMKEMAASTDLIFPDRRKTAKEAIQWLYFGYLAAIKTQNGAAMSVGRVSTFLDIYIQRDLDKGILTERRSTGTDRPYDYEIQNGKIRKNYFLYNQLFSGDPVWATLEVGGIGRRTFHGNKDTITVSCIHWRTWDRLRNQT